MRKNLYIVGARGFGRECFNFFRTWDGFSERYEIKGFLDSEVSALDGFLGYPSIVCAPEAFIPSANDFLVCALGAVKWRKQYVNLLLERGAQFATLVSPKATVHATAKIGRGALVLDNAVVSSDVTLGDYTVCFPFSLLGHDTQVGAHSVIESYVFCGGGAVVGAATTLHTRATILPHKKVGSEAVVGAGSVVVRTVKPNTTVFGVPAVAIDF